MHPHLARTGAVLLYYLFVYNRKGNQGNGYITLHFLGWNTSREAGVEAESELESESVFSGWSRSWSRSHLKFVDTTALVKALFSHLLEILHTVTSLLGYKHTKITDLKVS